jgi:hypothetical protein
VCFATRLITEESAHIKDLQRRKNQTNLFDARRTLIEKCGFRESQLQTVEVAVGNSVDIRNKVRCLSIVFTVLRLRQVIDVIKTDHIDCVVVGSRGHGLVQRTMLGSLSTHLAHHLCAIFTLLSATSGGGTMTIDCYAGARTVIVLMLIVVCTPRPPFGIISASMPDQSVAYAAMTTTRACHHPRKRQCRQILGSHLNVFHFTLVLCSE